MLQFQSAHLKNGPAESLPPSQVTSEKHHASTTQAPKMDFPKLGLSQPENDMQSCTYSEQWSPMSEDFLGVVKAAIPSQFCSRATHATDYGDSTTPKTEPRGQSLKPAVDSTLANDVFRLVFQQNQGIS